MDFSFKLNFTGKCFITLEYSKLEPIFTDTFTRFRGYEYLGNLLPIAGLNEKTCIRTLHGS